MKRRLILVTGAPRTATTPVGNLLARCKGAVSLYEPLGPTGLSWVDEPFPIVGDGLGIDQDRLRALVEDLSAFRFGTLKPQVRQEGRATLRTKILGSRTLHSLRLARLQPWSSIVIWKDPHAILMAPDLCESNVDVVVTVRTPWAHAASYRRLGWRSKAAQVYPRWSARFGRCQVCENFLDQSTDSVIAAALLWRMSYLPLVRTSTLCKVHLITSEDLELNERATYFKLIRELGLIPTHAVERAVSLARREAAAAEMSQKPHDWKRSVASVNRYWKEVLTDGDVRNVHAITHDVTPYFFRAGAWVSPF